MISKKVVNILVPHYSGCREHEIPKYLLDKEKDMVARRTRIRRRRRALEDFLDWRREGGRVSGGW